ncbi:ROK family protein [Pseudarthrobacter sp. CC12]|uniref:ROK family protein n=1 Tax=Pseudarthrobacter sp. CC12 TaxID=3029193 RepID=UPI00326341D1
MPAIAFSPLKAVRGEDLRRQNLAVVVAALEGTTLSLTELAKETGLVHGGVTNVVNQLLELGFIVEQQKLPSGARGRPSRNFSVADKAALAVGISAGKDRVSVEVVTLTGERLGSMSEAGIPLSLTPAEFSSAAFAMVEKLVKEVTPDPVPLSVAVAVPGRAFDGRLTSFGRHWQGAESVTLFSHAPAAVKLSQIINDGAAATVAEHRLGAASGVGSAVIMCGTDGIAGGLIDEGRLVQGSQGGAGSLGHMSVDFDGIACLCGLRGCLERYISLEALAGELGMLAELEAATLPVFADHLASLAAAGDAAVLAVLEGARQRIHRAVTILGPVFSPDLVILSGNIAPLTPWLGSAGGGPKLSSTYRVNWVPPIVAGAVGSRAVIEGASEIARQALLQDPLALAS